MRKLAVIPGLPALRLADGRVLLTRKFIEGMNLYADAWDGRVVALMREAREPAQELDSVAADPAALRFGVEIVPFQADAVAARVADAAVVLGGCHDLLHGFTARCRAMGVPCVHNTEQSLRTRV